MDESLSNFGYFDIHEVTRQMTFNLKSGSAQGFCHFDPTPAQRFKCHEIIFLKR